MYKFSLQKLKAIFLSAGLAQKQNVYSHGWKIQMLKWN